MIICHIVFELLLTSVRNIIFVHFQKNDLKILLLQTKVAADFDPSELLSDLKALKDTVKQQDRRIEHLEQRIAAFESE